MKILTIASIVLCFFVTFSGCKSVSEASKAADSFYKEVKEKNYQKIVEMLDEEALAATPDTQWVAILQAREEYWGPTQSYEQNGFSTSTDNGITKTYLTFTVKCKNGTIYEKIGFIQRKNGIKIYNYEYNKDGVSLD